jgi:hypothetical protein
MKNNSNVTHVEYMAFESSLLELFLVSKLSQNFFFYFTFEGLEKKLTVC